MKAELGEHWEYWVNQGHHVLRLNDRLHTPGITIFCRTKTFLFRSIILDEFGATLKIEGSRPWPEGLRHKRYLSKLKEYLIAQYRLEGA